MILACPNCAVRFRIPDRALQPDGRRVRCGRCRHDWRVDADGEEVGRPRPAPQPAAEDFFPEPARELPPEPEPVPPAVFVVPEEPPPAPTPEPRKRPVRDRAALRRVLRRSLAWAGSVATVGALAAVIYFHEVMVAEFPAIRPVYRLLQLMPEMSTEGLALENLRTEPDLSKLDPAALPPRIRVSGDVRNTSWVPRSILTLEGRLYDRRRLELNRWYVGPERRWLWPGETTSFASDVAIEAVRPAELSIRLGPLE